MDYIEYIRLGMCTRNKKLSTNCDSEYTYIQLVCFFLCANIYSDEGKYIIHLVMGL